MTTINIIYLLVTEIHQTVKCSYPYKVYTSTTSDNYYHVLQLS